MRAASVLRLRAIRNSLAVTALLVAGLFVLASSASAAAGTGGPAPSVPGGPEVGGPGSALFLGFVLRDEQGALPTKVRAVGEQGAVCGTASVQILDSGSGFYRMDVVNHATRAGCPGDGAALTFRLLYGSVDDGTVGIPSRDFTYFPGATIVVSLTPTPRTAAASSWLGTLPTKSGDDALLTWVGEDGTPVADALATLGVEVTRASHFDATTSRWVSYTPGGPAFLQTYLAVGYGDVVRVRLK